MKHKNYGILTSISWNSNKWAGPAITEDIKRSGYSWVKENHRLVEDLNFGYDLYPAESDGTFIAYTPMFDRNVSTEGSKYVEIVFFRSLNYQSRQNLIVGLYEFPEIGRFNRRAEHIIYKKYAEPGNVKARIEHIVLFENPILISDTIAESCQYLPRGKKLGQQGFNYLLYENVVKILDNATSLNQSDTKLRTIKFKFMTEFKNT